MKYFYRFKAAQGHVEGEDLQLAFNRVAIRLVKEKWIEKPADIFGKVRIEGKAEIEGKKVPAILQGGLCVVAGVAIPDRVIVKTS